MKKKTQKKAKTVHDKAKSKPRHSRKNALRLYMALSIAGLVLASAFALMLRSEMKENRSLKYSEFFIDVYCADSRCNAPESLYPDNALECKELENSQCAKELMDAYYKKGCRQIRSIGESVFWFDCGFEGLIDEIKTVLEPERIGKETVYYSLEGNRLSFSYGSPDTLEHTLAFSKAPCSAPVDSVVIYVDGKRISYKEGIYSFCTGNNALVTIVGDESLAMELSRVLAQTGT